jgi:holliday junction DNA helicase RuvA
VAVASDDTKTLTRVSGIGQKGAQRIILELKDRLGAPVGHVRAGAPASTPAPWKDQVLQALVGLGWSAKEADTALGQLAPVADEQIAATGSVEVAVLLRQALQMLGRS